MPKKYVLYIAFTIKARLNKRYMFYSGIICYNKESKFKHIIVWSKDVSA